MLNQKIVLPLLLGFGTSFLTARVEAATVVQVTIENLAPSNGVFLTPVWVGFHDGGFDLYDRGAPASAALERLAEDGNVTPINDAFAASSAGTVQGAINGPVNPPLAPGQVSRAQFTLDGTLATSRYFSYASMIIPSNDAFIANGNPLAFEIFDNLGNFLGADFIVTGAQVLDAGTEVNDEQSSTTAFFGQTVPNTGVTENGTVELHGGFIPQGPILSTPGFANADFTQSGYQVARISVTQVDVPESDTVAGLLILLGLAALGVKLGS